METATRSTRPVPRRGTVGAALLLAGALAAGGISTEAADSPAALTGLLVEYRDTPLGIDVVAPRFSWQMRSPAGRRGWSQSAYRVVVSDPEGAAVWDSGRIASGVSLGVTYAGDPLQPSTRYAWTVTAWDQNGDTASARSWFETGLMSTALSAWDGATWIGGGDDDLVLYSHYLPIFRVAYTVTIEEGSSRAGFVFGANVRLLEEHYDAMAAYLAYLETTIGDDGLISDNTLGDWLGPQNEQLGTDYLVTAYHVYDLWIVARTAEVLGRDEDAARYRARHAELQAFFDERFLNHEGRTLGLVGGGGFGRPSSTPPEWKVADTQTSYAVGLTLGAFSDAQKPRMETRLAETVERENVDDSGVTRPAHSLMTGFIGTAWISRALSKAGRDDLAYRLLQNARYPSWLYAIDQGATTIWERLDGYTVEDGFGGNNSMNSFNHYSFGAIGQWMMAYSLGIERDEPGFSRFVLQPRPDPRER